MNGVVANISEAVARVQLALPLNPLGQHRKYRGRDWSHLAGYDIEHKATNYRLLPGFTAGLCEGNDQ